jgi:succinyl-diaminopimelate desuccinylase
VEGLRKLNATAFGNPGARAGFFFYRKPMTAQELIEKTKQLVAIPSTVDNPTALREAFDFVAAIIKAYPDITIERFERNNKPSLLAYRSPSRPKKFRVLLNGHLDVVSANPEQFVPRVDGGRLYGRGALDMKGTALVLTDVFCELVTKVPYDLGLQIVCDEEVGGYDGVRLHLDNGVRAEFVVMGEYANHPAAIYNAARGLCWTEIAFSGRTSHGAHLWHGDNAVVKAGEFAAAVLRRYPTPDKETWTTTASIASLSTPNETFNKVPDAAILKIDFRFTQEDTTFKNKESVEAFIKSIDPTAKLINVSVFEPAVNVEELNPYVQGLSRAVKQAYKRAPQFLGRPGGSDGRHYALVDNDIVEFGLYGHGQHSDEEYVELASFEKYRRALSTFLKNPVQSAAQPPVSQERPEKVWYATYGSGIWREHFMHSITGQKSPDDLREYVGCTDKTPPTKEVFMSLPYRFYFAGNCPHHNKVGGGGCIFIDTKSDPAANTISRAYLIGADQFEEIVAQENFYKDRLTLPFAEATAKGRATIAGFGGEYNELIYCGERDGYPIFSVTAAKPEELSPPSPNYVSMLCRGLSEVGSIDQQEAVNYLLGAPGVAGYYHKNDLNELFDDKPKK